MVSSQLKAAVEEKLSQVFNTSITITKENPIGGGCINSAHKIETNHGSYFLKWNDTDAHPGMFEAEAKGLMMLQKANSIRVPAVIATGSGDNISFIVLELIEPGKRIKNFWQDFGERLAKLHKHTDQSFGLDHDNYIGSLPQKNSKHITWIDFFIVKRLGRQIEIASNSGVISKSIIRQFDSFITRLPELIPKEKPALLHGDLWNGNYMVENDGSACLIDPAVYYGHREMDLAMTKLFGGFDEEFYEAYNATFPLQPGFESRVDIHNLYPLIVHVNLFGGGYLSQVKSILDRF
jgi:protein-ribulosamine 3-kinase